MQKILRELSGELLWAQTKIIFFSNSSASTVRERKGLAFFFPEPGVVFRFAFPWSLTEDEDWKQKKD